MSESLGRSHKWFWSQRSDYARLQREVKSFCIDLAFLEARSQEPDRAWAEAARTEIQNVQEYLSNEDNIEGGWVSLHAARRHFVHGLSPGERQMQASILRAEAPKLISWRGKEMENLLSVRDEELTVHRITAAMALRDEYFSNQYHKIWLVGS